MSEVVGPLILEPLREVKLGCLLGCLASVGFEHVWLVQRGGRGERERMR